MTQTVSGATQKLSSWQPQDKPNDQLCRLLRLMIVEEVFARFARDKKPMALIGIFGRVQERVLELKKLGSWPREWRVPGKRTIDRRVNEAACPAFYEGGVPKIVAVTAGWYQPNPALFQNSEQ